MFVLVQRVRRNENDAMRKTSLYTRRRERERERGRERGREREREEKTVYWERYDRKC